jgi:hypothetical protein
MKELKDSVNAGAFDETMVVEAAIRATNYSGFCQFVQAVSHKISPEQFTALCTHYQQYLNDIKGEKRALIGNQKIAKRLRTFHDTPYDQLKPRTPSTCGRKRGSCKRKRVDNTITFVYENNPK